MLSRKNERVVRAIYLIINDYIKHGGNIKFDGRNIGTLLFEHSTNYSGLTSQQALIDKYNTNARWCNDHVWSRQRAGEKLITEFVELGSVEIEQLKAQITQFTTVNRVTFQENERLRNYQSRHVFNTPKQAYEQAKVSTLLKWDKGTQIRTLPEIYPNLCRFLK